MSWFRELPPTAGFPLSISDFFGNTRESTLEDKLAAWLDVPFVQIEASGTAALVIALHSLKRLSPRRTVIVSAFTCPLIALAVQKAGLKLKICDISLDDGLIDFDFAELSSMCAEDTLCILTTHIGGLPCDMEKTKQIAEVCGAFIIEDAAQSLGASRKSRSVGTAGDIGVFSLTRGKGLTIFDGGVLIAKDDKIRQSILSVTRDFSSPYSAARELKKVMQMIGYCLFYNPFWISILSSTNLFAGFDTCSDISTCSEAVAAKLSLYSPGEFRKLTAARSLPRLPQAVEENRLRAHSRLKRLRSIPNVKVLGDGSENQGSWPFLFLIMPSQTEAESVLELFSNSGLGITQLYPFALPDYRHLNYPVPPTHTPFASSLAARSLTITNSLMLTETDFMQIASVIEKIARNYVSTSGA